jgi:hypothetical protein
VDTSTSSHVEDTRPKENARGENRQNTKANRRCDAAKGILYGFVARLAGLKFPPANPNAALWTQAPLSVGLICEPPASGAILPLGPTGVYSSARLKTRALALSTNRLNAARRMASANTVAADAAEIAKRSSITQIGAEGPLSGSGAPLPVLRWQNVGCRPDPHQNSKPYCVQLSRHGCPSTQS